MNDSPQTSVNINHEKFLNQLEELATRAATAQAQIASDAARHEFRIRFNHYLQEKMTIAAQETYAKVLAEVQEFVNQFATSAATRALDVESSTVKQIEKFSPEVPQFASFSETLAQQTNKQSNLIELNDAKLNSEADKEALKSLGFIDEDNQL